jgi:serine phosphatase RsbU (regulator of sigma subunit)
LSAFFSNLYKLYTNDLKDGDVAKLIKTEAPEVYQFYYDNAKRHDYAKMGKNQKAFALVKDIIYTFLSKLSPIRRIAFTLAFLIFFYASFINVWIWAILSFLTLTALLAFEVAEKLTAANELDIAKNIQEELIMTQSPEYKSIQVASYSKPAKIVGGDFLNYFTLNSDDERHFYLLGDISGKGMLAALYMVRVHSLLMYLTKNSSSAREVLIGLNKILNEIFKPGLFFTAVGFEINKENQLKLFRAGHTPILYYNSVTKEVTQIQPKGIGLGMKDRGVFESTLEEIELTLNPDDILLLFSDGATEAVNEHNHEFGISRLEKNLLRNAGKPADQIIESINRSINNFTYNVPMRDDITMLVVKSLRISEATLIT